MGAPLSFRRVGVFLIDLTGLYGTVEGKGHMATSLYYLTVLATCPNHLSTNRVQRRTAPHNSMRVESESGQPTAMNCILYARVSTDRQARKDLSIPAQLAAMRGHAKNNGWHVTGHFVDKGESARTADRPQLKELILQCKARKDVDIVLVHKIDRLARNLVDFATIKAILKRKGIRLVSVTEPFEDNSVGQLMENILASISEWYSANLGEEVRKAYRTKLARGEWPHQPPLGYRSVEGRDGRTRHLPDKETSALVVQAFELFATGEYALRGLADEMYARGLKTRHGRRFSPESMKTLLTRCFYIGKMTWQGREYDGRHRPIVPRRLFYRVQGVLKRRSADSGEKGRLKFLLRGVAYCKACGRRLTAEIHPRGSYYRCLPDPDGIKCDQPYTPVHSLDRQLAALYERMRPPKEVLQLLQAEMKEIAIGRRSTAQKGAKALQRAIDDTESKQMGLVDAMLSGKVTSRVYERMDKVYAQKRMEAEARLAQLEVDYDDPLDLLDKSIVVASTLSYLHHRFDYGRRKLLLRAVFERIDVEDRHIVGVELKPPFSLLLGNSLDGLFEDRPSKRAREDIFEQLVSFTLSEQYAETNKLVRSLNRAARSFRQRA